MFSFYFFPCVWLSRLSARSRLSPLSAVKEIAARVSVHMLETRQPQKHQFAHMRPFFLLLLFWIFNYYHCVGVAISDESC